MNKDFCSRFYWDTKGTSTGPEKSTGLKLIHWGLYDHPEAPNDHLELSKTNWGHPLGDSELPLGTIGWPFNTLRMAMLGCLDSLVRPLKNLDGHLGPLDGHRGVAGKLVRPILAFQWPLWAFFGTWGLWMATWAVPMDIWILWMFTWSLWMSTWNLWMSTWSLWLSTWSLWMAVWSLILGTRSLLLATWTLWMTTWTLWIDFLGFYLITSIVIINNVMVIISI